MSPDGIAAIMAYTIVAAALTVFAIAIYRKGMQLMRLASEESRKPNRSKMKFWMYDTAGALMVVASAALLILVAIYLLHGVNNLDPGGRP